MAIEPGRAPGPVMSESYLFLDQAVQSYNANLPIVIVDNFGRGELLNDVQMDATFMLFDREQTGRADFSTVPNLSGDVHIKRRGSSTVIVDVIPSFNLEFVDGNNEDRDVNLLNFPPESDFIMYYPSVFDTSLINNSFVYALSCSNGVYAVKTRFVDVYLNTDGDDIEPADHIGVYVLMEKIKRGPDRVDVEKLEPEVVGGPEIAGGYMLKIDRPDPGDSGFHTTRGTPTFYCYFCYVYPKEGEMPAAQKTWIRNYLNQFESALYGSNFTDPQNGYVKYIDADSFIDHHILGDFSKDPDAFWLSTYMFKSRTGKLTMGPIWDFDRAFGFEGRSADPVGPVSFGDVQLPFNYDWWGRLFQDPDFMQKYIDRYFNLRDSSMSLAAMRAMVDSQAAELAESQAGNSSWPGNISRLKNWITARANFMDSIFIPRPAFGRPAGMVAPGTTVGLSGSGTIYYTLDGSDPRAPGGGVRSNALEYSGTPVSIPENVLITIRALSTTPAAPAGVLPWPSSADIAGKQWSAPRTALYAVATPDVAITEIMYNPREPADGTAETNFSGADFEFIELQNTADSVAQLTGVMIADGISFDFSYGAVRYVQPYEYVVAVKNPDAFAVRYPDWQDIHLAGTFEGKLDNAGEQLLLLTPVLQTNVLFSYDNAWYPQTDGGGYSLVKNNPGESTVDWGQKSGWRASGILDGTPGFPDEIPEPGAGVGFIVSLMIMNAKARRRGESRCPRAVSRCPMPDARGPRNHGSCVAAGE